MTRRLLASALLPLLVPGLTGGCRPADVRVQTALDEARYPDALAELRRIEPRLCHRRARWQAHYALERGLAHLGVGDAYGAIRWLSAARVWQERNPELLTPIERDRLRTAWQSMGLMPGDRPLGPNREGRSE